MPTLVQLKAAIAQGNDVTDNVLILNLDGSFELIPGSGVEATDNLNYVARWETFIKGNDFVGQEASEDQNFILPIFEWAESAWKEYKQTNRTRMMSPYS